MTIHVDTLLYVEESKPSISKPGLEYEPIYNITEARRERSKTKMTEVLHINRKRR